MVFRFVFVLLVGLSLEVCDFCFVSCVKLWKLIFFFFKKKKKLRQFFYLVNFMFLNKLLCCCFLFASNKIYSSL